MAALGVPVFWFLFPGACADPSENVRGYHLPFACCESFGTAEAPVRGVSFGFGTAVPKQSHGAKT